MEMHTGPRAVPVFLYTLKPDSFSVEYREGLTAEDICHFSAKECHIPRLSANLFAIYNSEKDVWLPPGMKVQPTETGLTFRMRFHMSRSPANITSLEKNVVGYMFEQYHHDFLHDRIPKITMEETLGLVVLDIVRCSNEKHISIQQCLRRRQFKKFLPKSLSKDLNQLDKWKLKKKIKKSLDEFRRCDQDVNNCHMMFLISLMEENDSWGVEEFQTVKGLKYEVSIAVKGVTQTVPADQARTFKLLFEDILNIGMMASREAGSYNWIVLVNQREDVPKSFLMESKETAESLVALIDGYCRLQVDFYHYLFQECAPPSLVQLVKSRCHGPIPLSCAKHKIEEAGTENGIYLIRQNPEEFFSYCLTVRMGGDIKNYKIVVNEVDGSVSLPGQRTFPDIRALVEHYRIIVNCDCLEGPLTKVVSYQPKEEALHMHDMSVLPETPRLPPPEPVIEWIKRENMDKRRQKLGSGEFTTVYRGAIVKPGKRSISVAIKSPKKGIAPQVQQKFCSSVDMMSSWNNHSIIKFLGIGAKFTLIMEFAPFGSMDKYLQTNEATINQNHLIAMGVQLIDGLEYLESRKIIHGNISAKNVLVVKRSPLIRIKLGDPMLSGFYHSLPMDRKIKNVRWTAPELLHSNMEPTLESDRWSFGMVLWQIWALGRAPFEGKTDAEVLQKYRCFEFPPYPANCLDAVNKLIGNCWQCIPSERYTCKQLLRELSSIYQRFGEDDGLEGMYWELPNNQQGDPDPIEEDLSEGMDEEEGSDEDTDDGNLFNPNPSAEATAVLENDLYPIDPKSFSTAGLLQQQDDMMGSSPVRRLMTFKGIEKVMEGTLIQGETIGKGNFGSVDLGIWKRSEFNQMNVAIKTIEQNSEIALTQFEEEIRRMSQCTHKNIAKVLGYVEGYKSHPLSLVMEYYPKGALNNFLMKNKADGIPVTLNTKQLFAQQVAQGMAYLGSKKIVHRDLAARNVLVASVKTNWTEPEVKICDFGLARNYTTEGYYMPSGKSPQLPLTFYAIECIENPGKFSVQSDVWSFGILLWEIFSDGDKPQYKDENGVVYVHHSAPIFLRQGNRLPRPSCCPQSMYKMMWHCWELDKSSRPSFTTLIQQLGHMLESNMLDNP